MGNISKYTLFFCLSFIFFNLSANQKVDSLENIILKSSDSNKVDAILELGSVYQSSDFTKSLNYAKDALFLGKKLNYEYGVAMAYNNIGYSLTDLGKYSEALDSYEKSIEIFKKLGEENKEAIAYNDVGYIYQSQGLVKKAIENYIKSLKILEELGDLASQAACLNNIGLLFDEQKEFSKALEYYNKSLTIKENLGDEKAIAVSLNNIGSIYFSNGQYLEAKEYFFKSLVKRKKTLDNSGIAQCLTNIAAIYKQQKDYDTSLEYLLQSKEIQIELNNKVGLASCLNSVGVIYRLKNDYQKAEEYLLESYNLSHSVGLPELIRESSISLSVLYQELKQFEKAFQLLKEYYQMTDSIENVQNSRKLMQVGMQYEFEKKITENELAQVKKNHEHEMEMKEQKIISYSFGIGLAAFLILSLVILKSLNDKRKANKRITQQKIEIEEKRIKLEEALVNITDSISYAKRIQEALLHIEENISKHLPPHFIFFQPKDIVSGDFYWSYEKDGNLYISAVDCTGHGVPGALMSMLGITFLNNINAESKVLSPADILNKLRDKVIKELGQNSKNRFSRDGMDISLIKINLTTKEVEWAGANNPLWIVRGSNIEEIKADREAINFTENPKPFTNHKLKIEKGDKLYMFTDGYADQFGGPKGKKLKYQPFKELLLSMSNKKITEQKEILSNHFEQWKGSLDQIDDVCVIGLEI
jgi:serine phosphatase RsbU (regulator of sigma subunit)/Tfp pilus assembly protein PilF